MEIRNTNANESVEYRDWKKIELVTPIDKEKNVKFYTENCWG